MYKFLTIISLLLISGCANSAPNVYFADMKPAERKSFLAQQVTQCLTPNIPKNKITDCVNRRILMHDAGAEMGKENRGAMLKENVENKITAETAINKDRASSETVKCAPEGGANQEIVCH